jgi:hypothetical protein
LIIYATDLIANLSIYTGLAIIFNFKNYSIYACFLYVYLGEDLAEVIEVIMEGLTKAGFSMGNQLECKLVL